MYGNVTGRPAISSIFYHSSNISNNLDHGTQPFCFEVKTFIHNIMDFLNEISVIKTTMLYVLVTKNIRPLFSIIKRNVELSAFEEYFI